jgi:hypothetical protein
VGVGFRKYHGKMGKWNVEVLVVLVRVKGKGFTAWSGVLHGGDVVAADGRSGHRGVCTGRHRGMASAVGRPSGDAWVRAGAGGGAREAVPAVGRRRQTQSRGGSGVVRGRRSREVSGDLFAILKKFRDPTVN